MKIGVIGCGNISGIYLDNAKWLEGIEVTAVADARPDAANAKAKEYGVKALSVEALLADSGVEAVLNLTVPKAHASVSLAALKAGKHVYMEKPMGLSLMEASDVMELARTRGLRVGCAPDTFLGGGIQTCRKLIDDGWIGRPLSATAFMLCGGHESWHPAPEFYYGLGGGPMLDMGPYYVTALINLLGPVKRLCGSAGMGSPERVITSQPSYGKRIQVETPTHLAGLLDFHSGAQATLVTSFDVQHHGHAPIEIYGSEGTLFVPDPNTFGGPVLLRRAGDEKAHEVPLSHGYAKNSRGLGLADMASAVAKNRPHRASAELASHALEVMLGVELSSKEGRHLTLTSRCERPEPLPMGLRDGQVD